MSGRGGRARGRGGKGGRGDGNWTWGAIGSAAAKAADGEKWTRGRGRGRGGGSSFWGHDTARHVIKSDNLKTRQVQTASWGRGHGKGGKGDGKGDRRPTTAFSKTPVVRVDEDAIGRHCEVKTAHKASILAMVMTEQGIYTASQDKTMKRWKPVKRDNGCFELVAEVTVPLPDSCHSLLYSNGWLFCGLWDGQVKAFAQDGAEVTLKGHTRRVTSLLLHQGILISASADREIRLWQCDAATKVFTCTHTLDDSMPGPIHKILVLGTHLIIGGLNGLAMLDLVSLKVTKLLPPTKAVSDLLEFQGHVIVAYADGSLRIFDAEGTLKSERKSCDAGPILKIAGLDSGPRVLLGHDRGQISTITLPAFEFKTEFQALGGGRRVDSLLCAGHDGIFLVGSQDGSLQLWQRVDAGLPQA